jgi:homoserine acetyltransferase
LADLRIVELSAFVAAPFGGMTMAQFGAGHPHRRSAAVSISTAGR